MTVVNAQPNDLPIKFSVCVNEGQDKLPTMYIVGKPKSRILQNDKKLHPTLIWLDFCILVV